MRDVRERVGAAEGGIVSDEKSERMTLTGRFWVGWSGTWFFNTVEQPKTLDAFEVEGFGRPSAIPDEWRDGRLVTITTSTNYCECVSEFCQGVVLYNVKPAPVEDVSDDVILEALGGESCNTTTPS